MDYLLLELWSTIWKKASQQHHFLLDSRFKGALNLVWRRINSSGATPDQSLGFWWKAAKTIAGFKSCHKSATTPLKPPVLSSTQRHTRIYRYTTESRYCCVSKFLCHFYKKATSMKTQRKRWRGASVRYINSSTLHEGTRANGESPFS